MKFVKFIAVVFVLLLMPLSVHAKGKVNDLLSNPPAQGGTSLNGATDERPLKYPKYFKLHTRRFETSSPTDNIRFVRYNPRQIVKIPMREMMDTMIVLPKGETFAGINMGNTNNFTLTPNKGEPKNVAVLSSVYPGVDGDLNIIGGSGNFYSFYIRSYSVKAEKVAPIFRIHIEDPTVFIRMAQINKRKQDAKRARQLNMALLATDKNDCPECKKADIPLWQGRIFENDYLRTLSVKVDPTHLDLAYVTSKGSSSLRPLRIFSDMSWTYFQYDHENFSKMTEVPVVYVVNENGYEEPINNRYVKGTIIAETVSKKWTIRSGDSYLCVRRVQ